MYDWAGRWREEKTVNNVIRQEILNRAKQWLEKTGSIC